MRFVALFPYLQKPGFPQPEDLEMHRRQAHAHLRIVNDFPRRTAWAPATAWGREVLAAISPVIDTPWVFIPQLSDALGNYLGYAATSKDVIDAVERNVSTLDALIIGIPLQEAFDLHNSLVTYFFGQRAIQPPKLGETGLIDWTTGNSENLSRELYTA